MSRKVSLRQYRELETELEYFKSLVQAFYSGETPDGAGIHHHIMAKWGRVRKESMKPTPAILKTPDPV